ncbi:TetR family transcriptional regulator [Streptomyces sp. SP18BB07]|uniref:TetR family transcriptional regulator n=1 Tax=Streptomyces sp. SP18BB07 TaxID=3002522 RepID=UPI002E75F056|nr:TetR family transcriptional regulator [Streptomyces sp. SP18BB07]MEE1760388.1 TetR family transcriptional regulator [Streptomyces sp. SP18BB07]
MATVISRSAGLRDITRHAVSARIAAVAVELFAEHGFDQVTVEQIAAAVGISPRSFHRYFPAKEDTVINDPGQYGQAACDAFTARPRTEPVWTSLREAVDVVLRENVSDSERGKQIMRIIDGSASLRARVLEKHLLWGQLLTPLVAQSLPGDDVLLRAQTLTKASLVCLGVALAAWAEPDETATVSDLLRRTFAAVQPEEC